MKIENISYVLMKVGNIEIDNETMFLTSDYKFTNDICDAFKSINKRTALEVKHYYEVHENHNCESDLKIVPLKLVYEW